MNPHRISSQQGVTLIEVLIALLVLSIGLLGLAGLQAVSLQHNHNAHLRSQATNLSYDILDRMRANRTNALQGAYTSAALDTTISCNPTLAPTGNLAARDLAQWRNQVACQLAEGAGAISAINNGTVTITLCWRERVPEAAEDDDEDSANGIPDLCLDAGLMGFSYTARL
ncbi:type IV pilus modification protein PilV [Thiorhodospira sibirica]|uniref:type IV pilus modification protein PilV n=1 Tax=Thiorhodospira sibirica TaxID=154347 RepID=UPI00022C1169|nr:type IV pilus modification protein PilV [Thiorhodospira sibirica]